VLSLYNRCDMGMAGRVWPDGRSLLDQPCLLVQAFDVISSARAVVKKALDGD